MPLPKDDASTESQSDSFSDSEDSDAAWLEAEEAVHQQEQERRLDEEDLDLSSGDETVTGRRRGASRERHSPRPRGSSSERDTGLSTLETSATSLTSATSVTSDDGGLRGRLQLQPDETPISRRSASQVRGSDTASQFTDEYADSRFNGSQDVTLVDADEFSDSDDSLGYGDVEESGVDDEDRYDPETPMRYIGSSAVREQKISQVVAKIKKQVFAPLVEASKERVHAKSGVASRLWKATEEAELVQAIEAAADPEQPESLFEILAEQLQRDEVDVRNKVMTSKGHVAMCYVRAFLGMEQLVTMGTRGPEIIVHDDNNHLLSSHILRNEVVQPTRQKQQLHRALRVDVQQVVDHLEAPKVDLQYGTGMAAACRVAWRRLVELKMESEWEPIATGWHVLREHAEVSPLPGTADQVGADEQPNQNEAVDVIEKGEPLEAYDIRACKDQVWSCVHHDVSGTGLVRVMVRRYYREGCFVPPSEVETEESNLRDELVFQYKNKQTGKVDIDGLINRAEESLERYPLLQGPSTDLEDELDRCIRIYDKRAQIGKMEQEQLVQDLMNLIVELEVVQVDLWTSLYNERGVRLLEELPQEHDVEPKKPVGFGSRPGVSKTRHTTHHSTGSGSAAPNFSVHVHAESQRHAGHSGAERSAVVSMMKHSRRQRQRQTARQRSALIESNLRDELVDQYKNKQTGKVDIDGLINRAEESLERYPLLQGPLEDRLDRCIRIKRTQMGKMGQEQLVQDLMNLIVELEVVQVDAPNFSVHGHAEKSQRHAGHTGVSMVKHSRRQRQRQAAGKRQAAASRSAASGTESVASAGDDSVRRARRSGSTSRAAGPENLMDKSLVQFLQHNDLVGVEQKLDRIGVTSPRALQRVIRSGRLDKAGLSTVQVER